MANIKWWEMNVRTKRFEEKSLRDILLTWDKSNIRHSYIGDKKIKITQGRSNVIEFGLYPSENYTIKHNKMYQNLPIIKDKFQLVVLRTNLTIDEKDITGRRKKASTVITMLESIENLSHERVNYKNWLDIYELNNVCMEIDELMTNVEAYAVLDILAL